MDKKQFYPFDVALSLFTLGIVSKGGYLSANKIWWHLQGQVHNLHWQ